MRNFKLSIAILSLVCFGFVNVFAGNNDRAGEAGSSQLLINPWTRSVGFGGANTASVIGLESLTLNVAGLAFTRKTEVMANYKNWLVGSDTDINSFGIAQSVGETGAIALSIMSISLGEIDITETASPEGGIGTFDPSLLNIDVAYSKRFSNTISGGLGLRIVSESISNISSRGFAFNFGIRYVTGENDQLKFAIALNNVGPTTRATGDGISFSNTAEISGSIIERTEDRRVTSFQLPALLNIGLSYDFYVLPETDSITDLIKSAHRVTAAGNFTANSFTNDQYSLGVEYAFKEMFMLRAGYTLESDTWFDSDKRSNAYKGPAFGASLVSPLNKKGTTLGFHYSYQITENFSGTHSLGLRFNL